MAKLFKVGGCVRDAMLGVVSNDIDFTFVLDDLTQPVEAGFAQMEKFLQSEGFDVFLSTPDCFTIRAKFPKSHKFAGLVADFVMARKEVGYINGTRHPILKLGTIEDDLARRDFTVNAMAEDEDGNLIDIFGGKRDLEMKVLRTPIDPRITMMDDPLRVLRAIRFSITKGFTIHPTIWLAFQSKGLSEKLELTVSSERIREEMLKMFKHDTIETLQMLRDIDKHHIRGFTQLLFGNDMWLKPTFEKR